jgi:DNA-binding transcriptional regulator GbsR (MarR family)
MSRTVIALQTSPAGLTVEQICEITGLSPETVKRRDVRELFNADIVDRQVNEEGKRTFKLKPHFVSGSFQGFKEVEDQ